jgi:hypothetical protein
MPFLCFAPNIHHLGKLERDGGRQMYFISDNFRMNFRKVLKPRLPPPQVEPVLSAG